MVEVGAADGPWVPVDHAEVHAPDEVRGVVRNELARGAAAGERDGRGLDPLRRRLRHALLEERLARHPVDPALHHRRALAQAAEDRRGALDVVVDEIELREAALGEERLGGAADAQLAAAEDDRRVLLLLGLRGPCPLRGLLRRYVLLLGSHVLKGCPIVIPRTALIVSGPFGATLSAEDVARAIARGLHAGGWPEPDICPIEAGKVAASEIAALLAGLDFDARMRSARAVVLAEEHLRESTLRGSIAFEIATRARQGGVPAYAVTAENALAPFDARILDLQLILEASAGPRALAAAGTEAGSGALSLAQAL